MRDGLIVRSKRDAMEFINLLFLTRSSSRSLRSPLQGKAAGIFCKVGSEITILTTSLIIPSESVACFATAEFFFSGSSTPHHTVQLNPQIIYERVNNGMVILGVPKLGKPKYEDKITQGLMVELNPLKLCTNLSLFPGGGDVVTLIAHPFGQAKVRQDLYVESVGERNCEELRSTNFILTTSPRSYSYHCSDLEEGILTFETAAGDGCHGAPIIFGGLCVAILEQPGIGPKANKARLMSKVRGRECMGYVMYSRFR